MNQEPVVIPEKLYFKIGEVCQLVGVQAHVLRYWETEFPMLSPQKNQSGQRSYRRRDVEMALRIKQLLYKEMFTIAGARKKLQSDGRSRTTPAGSEAPTAAAKPPARSSDNTPTLFDIGPDGDAASTPGEMSPRQKEALKTLANNLLELRELLSRKPDA